MTRDRRAPVDLAWRFPGSSGGALPLKLSVLVVIGKQARLSRTALCPWGLGAGGRSTGPSGASGGEAVEPRSRQLRFPRARDRQALF